MQESDLLKKTYITLKKTQRRLEELEQEKVEPIAVIGMSCRFPGGANDPDAFWDLLKDGVDASSEVPETRWQSRYFDDDPKTEGTTHASRANFITHPIDQFDAPFFSISAKEASSLDPQQRLLLEVVWEALEDAALDVPSLNGSRTGVFVGISSDDYSQAHRHSGNRSRIDAYSLTGTCFAPASGRISYTFGFQGPSVAIDTACSSSLVGLHFACRSLLEKESDLTVVGGVNLILSPIFHICSTKLGTISADGRCKTFDESANGYGRGEGCGVLVLRRLSDALKENDRILAVIRSTAVNQDGKSNGLTAPNGLAQEALIRSALQRVGLSSGDIGYFEAHGTGTPLGDPIELEAIARVINGERTKDNPVFVSSVKTNIGHLEAAAGVSGIIKVIQSLRNAQIPPHLHLRNPSHHIPWDILPVRVPTELTPWHQENGSRLACISSFGFSGTNAHAVLEEAPKFSQGIKNSNDRPYHVLPLAARSDDALHDLADRYIDYLQKPDAPPFSDICYTAGSGRTHFPHRIAAVAQSQDSVLSGLQSFWEKNSATQLLLSSGAKEPPKIAFLYTGQGAQYTGMGRDLYDIHPVFKNAIDACDDLYREWYQESLIDVMYGGQSSDEKLAETKYTQPATFAIQYALTQLWKQWGIKPDVVTGHSIGEFAASVTAGILPLEDAFRLVSERGRIMQVLPNNGGMHAVMADETDVSDILHQYNGTVAIAALNAPQSIVLSGTSDALQEISQSLQAKGISTKALHVSHAFHSPLMNQAADEFAAIAQSFTYNAPNLSVISTVSGNAIHDGEYRSAEYWAKQILLPVRFRNAVASVANEGARLFVEIGPGSTLSGLAIRCIPMENKFFLASLSQKENDWKQIVSSLGRLYVEGVDVDWKGFDSPFSRRKVSLPYYPFQRQTYYMQPLFDSVDADCIASSNLHTLLGQKVSSPALPKDTVLFQANYTTGKPSFLKQHIIFGKIISPAAAHISHALSAACLIKGERPRAVEDISFTNPLVVEEDEVRTVQTLVRDASSKHPRFELLSCCETNSQDDWHTHSTGTITVLPDSKRPDGFSVDEVKQRCQNQMTPEEFYQYIENAGYSTGPHFQCIRDIFKGTDESLCHIRTNANFEDNAIHPGLIDSILQTVLPGCEASASEMLNGENILIPLHMNTVQLFGSLKGDLYCHNQVQVQPDVIKSNIHVVNGQGETVLVIQDFLLRKTTRETLYRDLVQTIQPMLYHVDWIETETHPQNMDEMIQQSNASYFIAGNENGFGDCIANELREHGKQVTSITRTGNLVQDIHQLCNSLTDATANSSGMLHIIHLWNVDETFTNSRTAEEIETEEKALCESILSTIKTLQTLSIKANIWIVTKNAFAIQTDERSVSPTAQSLWGLGRTIAMESPDIWGGLIDCDASLNVNTAQTVLKKILQPDGEDQTAIRKGNRVYAARLVSNKNKERSQNQQTLLVPDVGEEEAYYLAVHEKGTLDGLAFKTRSRKAPGENEIEIHLHVSGLNFRDVLNVLGQYPGDAGQLGFECGGVVTSVGANISGIHEGDEVIVMAAQGCMANFITVDQSLVVKKPDGMSVIEAVTIPATFLTAYYALHEKGKLNSGDKILIHAGAGGVGMAAVQLAKLFGAEVFATAGSDEKREYLKFIGVDHALNSRTLDFADDINQITNGSGVQFVLNSLSGDYIGKSFSVLAPNGWFLEMGKIGIWSQEQVQQHDSTIHYHPFDLAAIAKEDPQCIRRMWGELMVFFTEGKLKPLPQVVFPLDEAGEAFRYMAQAKHIGKIVFTRDSEIQAQRIQHDGLVRENASYLITGGLGDLGLLTAAWLVEQGAKSVILTSRSNPKVHAEERIKALRESGVDITVALGDVSVQEDVDRILKQIKESLPPLKGIIHAAGLLRDSMLAEQNWETFQPVLSPKVKGAWNLHQTTQFMSLDFFVLFSSVACLIGNMGQSNYSTANSFLDGLAHFRRRNGLPAVSINWGPWADAGMAANLESNPFERQGIHNLQVEAGLKAMQNILENQMTQCCVFDVNWDTYIQHHDLTERTRFYSLLTTQTSELDTKSSTGQNVEARQPLRQELQDKLPSQRHACLVESLQSLCRVVLGYSESEFIHEDMPLTEQGFDSLMTVDVRNRLIKLTDSSLPASLLFDYPTLNRLADHLIQDVLVFDEDTGKPQDAVRSSQPAESLLSEIDDLLMPQK